LADETRGFYWVWSPGEASSSPTTLQMTRRFS
jgi:hypothetical protein